MTSTEIRDDVQERHIRWVGFLERATKTSLTELAKKAGLPHTTLKRITRNGYVGHLTPVTVAKVKAFTKLPGPDEFELPEYQKAMLSAGLAEEAVPYDLKATDPRTAAVKSYIAGRNNVHAWTMKNSALERAGVLAGDALIIDHTKKPAPGDVVCAQVYDQPGGARAETVIRLYRPGWLVTAAADPLAYVPIQIVESKVAIMGTMIGMLRDRA